MSLAPRRQGFAAFGMNIVDPVLFQAKLNPAAPAICVPGAARPLISYGRLAQAIHNISRAALSCGLARGLCLQHHFPSPGDHGARSPSAALVVPTACFSSDTFGAASDSPTTPKRSTRTRSNS
jgi:hypothetical protein